MTSAAGQSPARRTGGRASCRRLTRGTPFRTSGDPILNLRPPEGIFAATRSRNQLDLLAVFNKSPVTSAANPELMARVASYELAYRMQSSAPEAVDLATESAETKRLYGLDNPRTERFGRRCLLARRLVEAAESDLCRCTRVAAITMKIGMHMAMSIRITSSTAARPISRSRCSRRDLKRSGLLDETLVVWTGEFGRTPTGQNGKGRDHSPRGFTAWLAGGGVKGGQALGSTDDFGYAAVDKKVHVHDFHATILHLLGFDHTLLTYFHAGREMRLTDVEGRVIKDLLA